MEFEIDYDNEYIKTLTFDFLHLLSISCENDKNMMTLILQSALMKISAETFPDEVSHGRYLESFFMQALKYRDIINGPEP